MTSAAVVELVSADGQSLGPMDKLSAHRAPGHLHRAFSALLFDEDGRLLLQRRAEGKYHFAGRWSNTACGHPAPGGDLATQAAARTFAELGIRSELTAVGAFTYRAEDAASGLVEHEIDTVFVGYLRTDTTPEPDPDEVSATRFVALTVLRAELVSAPERFTPWLDQVLTCAERAGHPCAADDWTAATPRLTRIEQEERDEALGP